MKHLDRLSMEDTFREGNILSKFSASTGYSNLLEAMPTSEEDLETHKRFIDSLLDHQDLSMKYTQIKASLKSKNDIHCHQLMLSLALSASMIAQNQHRSLNLLIIHDDPKHFAGIMAKDKEKFV